MPPFPKQKTTDRTEPYSKPKPAGRNEECLGLACSIEQLGERMDPCSLCVRQKRKCTVDVRQSSKCSECIRSHVPCDVKIPFSELWEREVPNKNDWSSIRRQREELDLEEEEAMSKILRLRKQKRFLAERELEMARRGLKYIEELDALEWEEKVAKEEAERQKQTEESEAAGSTATPTSEPLAFSLPDGVASDPNHPFWVDLGVAEGSWQASQDN